MIPGTEFSGGILFLYLLAFAAAAAGLLLPALTQGSAADRRCRNTGTFLQVLVVTGILPSLQIILDALDIIPGLPGAWPLAVILLFNALIISGIGLSTLIWSRLIRSFSPRPFFSDRLRAPAGYLLVAVTAAALALQTAALVRPDPRLLDTAGDVLAGLIVVIALVILDSFLRTLRKQITASRSDLVILRGFAPFLLVLALAYVLLPYRIASALPPLGLTVVFTAGIILYRGQSRILRDDEVLRNRLFDDAGLSAREREIALMLSRGLSYREISEQLFVSLSTVQTHVTRIYGKLKVNSKTELSLKIGAPK